MMLCKRSNAMTRWSFRLGVLLLFLPLTACGTHVYHKVQKGDTLYSISWRYGQDYREVAAWNGIRPPYTINAGQRLRVAPHTSDSLAQHKQPAQAKSPQQTASRPQTSSTIPSKKASVPTVASSSNKSAYPDKVRWAWPVKGKLINTFSKGNTGNKGLDIAGRHGMPIRAAGAGRVVYSGSGLSRYGNLLIVKHNENFLSAYAHNQKLLVKEGDFVKDRQVIAHMGSSGTDQAMLHFEIRYNGRPVNPLRYLP